MRIKNITSRIRRDFWATLECEHCGGTRNNVSCYDDAHFHNKVLPEKRCHGCGKQAPNDYTPETPKYESHVIV